MKYLFTFLVSLALLALPVVAAPKLVTNTYVAVLCSHDLKGNWGFPQFHTDFLDDLDNWDDLAIDLDIVVKEAAGRPIFLDMEVHGDDTGLQVRLDDDHDLHDANMGWVLYQIQKHCEGNKVVVCFECCYAGRAYKKTIRGVREVPGDKIYNYPIVPKFPVYGTGDSHSVMGNPMYLQWVHGERRWWVDLREYDTLGKNKKLHPKEAYSILVWPGEKLVQPTELDIYNYVGKYRYPKEN